MARSHTPELMRQQKRDVVLDAIRAHGPISRVELARQLHITPATITRITRTLLDEGLIREEGEGENRGAGRKPVLLCFNPRSRLVIGIYVNSNQITGAVTDLSGAILTRRTSFPCAALSEATLRNLLSDLLNIDPSYHPRLTAVCVGAHPSSPVEEALLTRLQRALEVPVLSAEVVALAAHGEARWGTMREQSRFAVLYLGSHSYSCLYLDGVTHVGNLGLSPTGQSLGARLCDAGLQARVQAALDSGMASVFHNSHQQHPPSSVIFEAARQGDPVARLAIEDVAGDIAFTTVWRANAMNLSQIVLAGPWAQAADVLLPATRAQMRALSTQPPDLLPADLGNDAPLLGAISVAIDLADATV